MGKLNACVEKSWTRKGTVSLELRRIDDMKGVSERRGVILVLAEAHDKVVPVYSLKSQMICCECETYL